MAATMGTLDLMAMEQQNLRQSIGWLYVEVEKLNEKFWQEMALWRFGKTEMRRKMVRYFMGPGSPIFCPTK